MDRRTGRVAGPTTSPAAGGRRRLQELVGRSCDASTLGDPTRRASREDRPAPDQRRRVGEGEAQAPWQGCWRCRGVASTRSPRRRAPGPPRRRRPQGRHRADARPAASPRRRRGCRRSESASPCCADLRRASATTWRGGQAVIRLQPRRTASRTAEAVCGIATRGRQHHHQVERAGPTGKARAGPGDERHRAPRLENGTQQPSISTGGYDRTRRRCRARARRCCRQHLRPRVVPGHQRSASRRSGSSPAASTSASSSRASSNMSAIVQLSRRQGSHSPSAPSDVSWGFAGGVSGSGRRASSTSITGMSSRTG